MFNLKVTSAAASLGGSMDCRQIVGVGMAEQLFAVGNLFAGCKAEKALGLVAEFKKLAGCGIPAEGGGIGGGQGDAQLLFFLAKIELGDFQAHHSLTNIAVERGLGVLLFGDVVDHGHDVVRHAAVVAYDAERGIGPNDAGVLADVALQEGEGVRFAGTKLGDALDGGRAIVGVSDIEKTQLHELLAGVTEDVAELLVDPKELALGVGVSHADSGLLESPAEELLAFAQSALEIGCAEQSFRGVDDLGPFGGAGARLD